MTFYEWIGLGSNTDMVFAGQVGVEHSSHWNGWTDVSSNDGCRHVIPFLSI